MSQRACTLVLSGILMGVIIVASLLVAVPRDLHGDLERATGIVRSGEVQMTQGRLVEDRERKKLNVLQQYLYDQGSGALWGTSYSLAGAAGSIVWLWLVFANLIRAPVPRCDALLARIGVGAVAGFLTYLLPAGSSLAIDALSSAADPELEPLLWVVAMCSGIFSPLFYERLEQWYRDWMYGD